MSGGRIAVVLFNLGGPERPEAVRPFLFNLFNDPAIIPVAAPLRWLLAQAISWRRAPIARAIYAHIGGASPLLGHTREQARALEVALGDLGEVRVFVAMRYWHPLTEETAREVAAFAPDDIVLLPLYPQFSTTTTGSSRRAWERASGALGITAATRSVCCYPSHAALVGAFEARIARCLDEAAAHGAPRVLFSAHGLPKRVVAKGDPYQWQVEQTAAAIVGALARPKLDWVVCYQSRVGRLQWIGPSTDAEIVRAGADGVPLVVAPIAFVSEHSETLVELDIEYAGLAARSGVPAYLRVPALGCAGGFIACLADLVRRARSGARVLCSQGDGRICPAGFGRCPNEE